eukprot:scaffold19197_cov40-Cyclotella_meneghiniana.AAC.5
MTLAFSCRSTSVHDTVKDAYILEYCLTLLRLLAPSASYSDMIDIRNIRELKAVASGSLNT